MYCKQKFDKEKEYCLSKFPISLLENNIEKVKSLYSQLRKWFISWSFIKDILIKH